jgi:hypothetical protein
MRRVLPVFVAFLATACNVPMPNPEAGAACIAPPSPSASDGGNLYLPTYCPMEALPAAEVHGRLVEADGCLWIDVAGERRLPLWPHGSRIERDDDSLAVVNADGTHAVIGREVSGGGGEFAAELLVETIGEEVPEACRGANRYLLVYQMR